jgi:23S rRNA (uracil1939-C5)-methyltransferase
MKQPQFVMLTLEKIVGGGQALGTLDDGRKAFVWGGLPGEHVTIRITKKKSHFVEGVVTEIHNTSPERVEPLDPESYLSTSPWQIMSFESEQHYKAALIEEAFELHDIVLPQPIEIYTDDKISQYRNKVEFSWFSTTLMPGEAFVVSKHLQPEKSNDAYSKDFPREAVSVQQTTSNVEHETLGLAFFRRGSKGKIVIDQCSLLPEPIMALARAIRDLLHSKDITARQLKTLLIRCDQRGNCVWQLYTKHELPDIISAAEAGTLPAQGGEVIYSDLRSPASRITKRLAKFGDIVLQDELLGTRFRYATEGFFQVNVPVYEQALRDMKQWVKEGATLDMYSGVGTIGLIIGGDDCTLVEIDEHAVREMRRNITELDHKATAVLAPSEKALEYITHDITVILDPPRAGLHRDVVERLLETLPPRIIYLSCNPVTQARDVAFLSTRYGIRAHQGYNFFPRTPHIEHLIILDIKA